MTDKTCPRCEQLKPSTEFHRDRKNADGLCYYCKACANASARASHSRRKTEGGESFQRSKRAAYLKREYGLSLEAVEYLFASQQGACAICKTKLLESGGHTHIDHCHETGRIRGILCTNCNRGLGHFQDKASNIMAAYNYLKSHKEAQDG